MSNGQLKSSAKRAYLSILLALLALGSVAAATTAWFSIADLTKVHSMSMQITNGLNLRFDVTQHEEVTDYKSILDFDTVADVILEEKGFDMRQVPLEPVTSSDGVKFYTQRGNLVSNTSGAYLEFDLHFMASENMTLAVNGIKVTSKEPKIKNAMYLSYTADGKTFILKNGLANPQRLCKLVTDEDKPVTVRIWLEGSDPACDNDLQGSDYSISMDFTGLDIESEQ